MIQCWLKLARKKRILEKASEFISQESGFETYKIYNGLIERERLGSTGIGFGVAIPHCRLSDLKIDHPFNTYKYYGLPPRPISYVGKKTLDIIFQTYETDFLFYFFNNSLNRHIFSKTFAEHKKKLNEFRYKK